MDPTTDTNDTQGPLYLAIGFESQSRLVGRVEITPKTALDSNSTNTVDGYADKQGMIDKFPEYNFDTCYWQRKSETDASGQTREKIPVRMKSDIQATSAHEQTHFNNVFDTVSSATHNLRVSISREERVIPTCIST